MNKKEIIASMINAGYYAKSQQELECLSKEELNQEIKKFNDFQMGLREKERQEREVDFEKGDARIVEVVASYSCKQNLGNYQSQDFFCSMKAETLEADAKRVYKALHFNCYNAVQEQINLNIKPF